MTPLHVSLRQVVEDPSAVGAARRRISELAARLGGTASQRGQVALVVTELGHNLVRHTPGGELLARGEPQGAGCWLEILSVDRGPGMASVSRCFEDGFSTVGTSGTGLGAIARAAHSFDLHTRVGEGTVLSARLWLGSGTPPERAPVFGAICVPHPDEEVSGDGYGVRLGEDGRTHLLVVDGLGHGLLAAEAARVALECFEATPGAPPDVLVSRLHEVLRPTRGAAIGLCTLEPEAGTLHFTGVGNISGALYHRADPTRPRGLASHNGTAGYLAPNIQTLTYPWEPGGLLVLYSDGLLSRWSLSTYPGLVSRDPAVIAGVLYRDFARGRDDLTVLAIRAERGRR